MNTSEQHRRNVNSKENPVLTLTTDEDGKTYIEYGEHQFPCTEGPYSNLWEEILGLFRENKKTGADKQRISNRLEAISTELLHSVQMA